MRIIYSNLLDNYTLTASQEDSNYPVENVQDIRLAKTWRTITASASTVVIDGGGAKQDIFQATTNLLEDTDNLTLWTTSGSIVTSSGLFYDSSEFAKVVNAATAAGFIYQDETATATTLTPSGNVICRKGSSAGNIAKMLVYNITGSAEIFTVIVDFDNYPNAPGTAVSGNLRWYGWIDTETVELHYTCSALGNLTDDIQVRLFGSPNATINEYTYWMRPQLENLTYDTPYVDGSRAANHPDETFEMRSQFTIDMIIEPWFVYGTSISHRSCEWYIDATHRFIIYYNKDADKFYVWWIDGGSARLLNSQQFDDGSSYVNINQRIRIIASIDLTTGDTTGSRLIVIPQESGAIFENTSWSGNIDALSSTFPTLSFGHESSTSRADSQYEYLRIYAGTLVGTVSDNDTADALLADMDTILEKNYLVKLTVDSAAILNHNLSADATIKIEGNDYDSWNGPPVSETMTWRAETIVKFITSVSYPFWRFSIVDPNVNDGFFEVGRFILGPYLQIDPSSLVEFPEKHPRSDGQNFSISNQMYSDVGIEHKELDYRFERAGNAMKNSMETMWGSVGKFKPFLFMNFDTDYSVIEPLYCAIIEDIVFESLKYSKWNFALNFRECD